MFLETTDGVALLGYAGLGDTTLGTEPSDWMRAVLRTRNFPLEQSLGVLAEAMQKQVPRHVAHLTVPVHNIIVPAFLDGETRLYTIDLQFAPDRKSYEFRWARHRVGTTTLPPRIGLGGTGGIHLLRRKDKSWRRDLLGLVKANDRGQVSPDVVADHLADLNYEVSQRLSDESVGPRCVVAWRYKTGGGDNAHYTGTTRDASSPCVPTITRGVDIEALVALPHLAGMFDRFEARQAGQPVKEPSEDEINAELASLPNKPDENLR